MGADRKPTIAVLSGKGGAGKTFVSVNLAAAAGRSYYLDCDIEEPNGHLFLKPESIESEDVTVLVPKINLEQCDACGLCVDFCRFNALAHIGSHLLIFEEICHSCGGCVLVCPSEALTEKDKVVGRIEKGRAGDVIVITGILNIGEVSGVPLIEKIQDVERNDGLTIIDCPPGTACSVLESITYSDYCLIVAEPTLLGLHNFQMVLELVSLLKKPFGVVINKFTKETNPLEDFCMKEQIPIMARIPHDLKLAKTISTGRLVIDQEKAYLSLFKKLLADILGELN